MTAAENIQALPTWIWLLGSIFIIGLITFIYSRGNWRTTLSFTGIILAGILAIIGWNEWDQFLSSHFIGQFDELGIPFRKAGPGWSMLLETWPLWLVPSLSVAGVTLVLDNVFRHFNLSQPTQSLDTTHFTATQPNIGQQLASEALKKETADAQEKLAIAIRITEEHIEKNVTLEAALIEKQVEHEMEIEELQAQITLLQSELEDK